MRDRKHIMILEDNELNAKIFHDLIDAYFDHTIISVFKHKIEGITEAYETEVDLFLTDIQSPDMSGMDFIRWVKSDPQFNNIPVVVCSAVASSKVDQLHLIAAGADDATFKAIKVKTFLAVIQASINGASGIWPESETSQTSIVLTSETKNVSAMAIERWLKAGLDVVDARFNDKLLAGHVNSLRNHVMLGAEKDGKVWKQLAKILEHKDVAPLKHRDPFSYPSEFGCGEKHTFVQYLIRHILEAFDGIREAIGEQDPMNSVLPRPVRRAVENELFLISEFVQRLPTRLKESEPNVPWSDIERLLRQGPLLHSPNKWLWEWRRADMIELLQFLEASARRILVRHLTEIIR